MTSLSKIRRILGFVALVCCSAMLGACSDLGNVTKTDALVAADNAQPWLTQLAAQADQFRPAAPAQFPQDFQTHPDVFLESFSIQAILMPDEQIAASEKPLYISLIAQIDSLGLKGESGPDISPDQSSGVLSEWEYQRIVRSSHSAVAPGGEQADQVQKNVETPLVAPPFTSLGTGEFVQVVERLALGLSSISPTSISIRNQIVSIESASQGAENCERRYTWSSRLSAVAMLRLELDFSSCPDTLSLTGFNQWQQATSRVSAQLTSYSSDADGVTTPMIGVAWISHAWGSPPSPSGAVLIDTLQVKLDDGQLLDVSRSKRRSGRGPKSVSATLVMGTEAVPVSLSWQDNHSDDASTASMQYPDSILISDDNETLELLIEPLHQFEESDGPDAGRLPIRVRVSGTQTGAGFLVYQSVTPSL